MTGKDDDRDLAAFRYIAGEIPPAEAETFELLLADNQTLRETVCRMVELSQHLQSANRASTIYSRRTDHKSAGRRITAFAGVRRLVVAAGWMAVVAAITVMVSRQTGMPPAQLGQTGSPRSDSAQTPPGDEQSPDFPGMLATSVPDGLVLSQFEIHFEWTVESHEEDVATSFALVTGGDDSALPSWLGSLVPPDDES